MKKIVKVGSIFLTMALLVMVGTPTQTYAREMPYVAEYDDCYVNTDGGNLNCRTNAGVEYPIVGKFKNGTKLAWSIFGKNDSLGRSWTQVSGKDINGKTISGWVLDSYLKFVTPSSLRSNILENFIIDIHKPDVG